MWRVLVLTQPFLQENLASISLFYELIARSPVYMYLYHMNNYDKLTPSSTSYTEYTYCSVYPGAHALKELVI